MSSESQRTLVNGHANAHTINSGKLNRELEAAAKDYRAEFHGDELLGDKQIVSTGTLFDILNIAMFQSVLSPQLGQAGAPYAKTVPSKTHVLGAQPDPGDIFDRLMAQKPDKPGYLSEYVEVTSVLRDPSEKLVNPARFITAEDYLTCGSSLSEGLVDFKAKEIAVLGLTAMIKVLAQVNNLRRGHDTQGKLKKINIDQTYEGDANSMAPEGMEKIRCMVEKANSKAGKKVFDERILKPRTETYLTPKWDKMVLFPTSTHIFPYLFTTF
ncbi:MAG: hypothetical protein Q9161_005425 [Pseudevernia consocians]